MRLFFKIYFFLRLNNMDIEEFKYTDEQYKEALDKTLNILKEKNSYDENVNLVEDKERIKDQNWAVIQFVGKTCKVKTTIPGFKILGIFYTEDDALELVDLIKKDNYDKHFDTYIVELYKFVLSYPIDCNHDEYMNNVIIRHKFNIQLTQELYNIRKNDLVNGPKIYHKDKPDEIPDFNQLNTLKNEEIKINNNNNNIYRDKVHKRIKEKLEQKNKDKIEAELKLIKSQKYVPEQEYVVLTIIKEPICTHDCYKQYYLDKSEDPCVIKIKGAFKTEDEAKKYCEKLLDQKSMDEEDNITFFEHDITIVEMYNWVSSLPNLNDVNNEYANKTLDNLDKTHKNEASLANNYSQTK